MPYCVHIQSIGTVDLLSNSTSPNPLLLVVVLDGNDGFFSDILTNPHQFPAEYSGIPYGALRDFEGRRLRLHTILIFQRCSKKNERKNSRASGACLLLVQISFSILYG